MSVSDAPDGAYHGIEDDTANAKMRKPASRTREERKSAHADLKHAHESRVSRDRREGAHTRETFKASKLHVQSSLSDYEGQGGRHVHHPSARELETRHLVTAGAEGRGAQEPRDDVFCAQSDSNEWGDKGGRGTKLTL